MQRRLATWIDDARRHRRGWLGKMHERGFEQARACHRFVPEGARGLQDLESAGEVLARGRDVAAAQEFISCDIKSNISLIKDKGFNVLSHFTLPKSCWIDFYLRMDKEIKKLKKKYLDNKIALQVFENCKKEIEIYDNYSDYFGYEFFIMQKK